MKKSYLLLLTLSQLMAFSLIAQPSTAVCVRHKGGDILSISIKPTAAFSGVFSNMEFTINPPPGVSLSIVDAKYGISLQSGTTYGHANAQTVSWISEAEETILNLRFSGGSGKGNFTVTGFYCELNGADKSGVVYCSADNVSLPLELLSFNAMKQKGKTILNWQTVSEKDLSYFDVEKSIDGINFKNMISIKSKGRDNAKAEYAHVDSKPFEGLTYYRLKIIDNDESYSYSKVETIEFEKSLVLKVYPVPTDNSLNIVLPNNEAEVFDISIVDMSGRIITVISYRNMYGKSDVQLDVGDLSSGTYILNLEMSSKIYSQKVVIKK